MAFRRIGILMKPLRNQSPEAVFQLLEFLEARGVAISLDETAAGQTGRPELRRPAEDIPLHADLLIVLGGDGTMLAAVRQLAGRPVPILGINFGSLGFLTEVSRERMIPVLAEIFDGKYRLEERMMLRVEVFRGGQAPQVFHALNDAVLNYGALARIIDVEVFVNGQFLTHYRADGLVVSTPTGSTAYALSAGGPILVPTTRSLILAPICPHTLTHRPLVLDGSDTIRIRLASAGNVMLTVDGQTGLSMAHEDEVQIRKSDHLARLVCPEGQSFFDVLSEKLKWGQR
jgi:NAD+ kinase